MMQIVFTRRPDHAQLLCSSGQLPGAEAANTVEALMQACQVCHQGRPHALLNQAQAFLLKEMLTLGGLHLSFR